MARPKIVWTDKDFKSVEYMCLIHCTGEEIAGVMGVDYDTLNRLIKDKYNMGFSDYYKSKASQGKMSLRRLQWKSAESGNTSMLIFLGKQWLGQKDIVEAEVKNKIEVVNDVPSV